VTLENLDRALCCDCLLIICIKTIILVKFIFAFYTIQLLKLLLNLELKYLFETFFRCLLTKNLFFFHNFGLRFVWQLKRRFRFKETFFFAASTLHHTNDWHRTQRRHGFKQNDALKTDTWHITIQTVTGNHNNDWHRTQRCRAIQRWQ